MTDYAGRGDPARSMELLWDAQRTRMRGPKPGLDLERIVRAAIDVADADGLTAMSMRRVADRLGVGTMSLYTYVPGKAELVDVMLDTVMGEEAAPRSAEDGWRAKLEACARAEWALYHRHPWMLQVSGARALLGPNETARYDATLRAVWGTGLTARETVLVAGLIAGYVRGAAQWAVEAAHAEQRTGTTDEQWWAARAPIFARFFDATRYPTVTSVHSAGGFDAPQDAAAYNLQFALDSFEFGLQRVLDGIEGFIHERSAQHDSR